MRTRIHSFGLFGLFLAVAMLFSAPAAGKSLDEYLHGGAAKYIQGRLQEAGVEVEEGIRKYPNDARLKALADQLKKMKDQKKQDQGGQSGGDQNKDKQDKQDSSGQGKDGKQDQKDQDKEKEKEKQEEAQEKEKDKGDGEKPQDQEPKPQEGKEGDSSGQTAGEAKPGQMSKEEAERLLNSYQDDEKREQKNLQRRNRRPVQVEEDW
jgi:hypothetical protein